MEHIRVVVLNYADLERNEFEEGVAALRHQVTKHFGPIWKVEAELFPVACPQASTEREYPGYWALVLLDERIDYGDQPSPILGYHDLTRDGLPLGKVFVNRVPECQDWTHVASHELLEMLADPDITATVYDHPDALTVRLYAREVCDPCAAYGDGYRALSRQVSDFVRPAWFSRAARAHRADGFDWRGLITDPFVTRPGGYIGVFDPEISAWRILDSQDERDELDEPREVGTRLERRSTAGNRQRTSDLIWHP
jgi:hypothetical protein